MTHCFYLYFRYRSPICARSGGWLERGFILKKQLKQSLTMYWHSTPFVLCGVLACIESSASERWGHAFCAHALQSNQPSVAWAQRACPPLLATCRFVLALSDPGF